MRMREVHMKVRVVLGATSLAVSGFLASAALASDQQVDASEQAAITAEIELTGHAFGLSEREDHHDDDHSRVREICSKVKLTDDQKVAVRDALIEHKKERIQLAAEKKIAALNYL